MAELADEIFVAYALPGGSVEKVIAGISHTGKTISSFKTGQEIRILKHIVCWSFKV